MNHASDAYLETQVTTATPHRLRLILIEGAIRFARMTLQHWEADEDERALETLIRCQGIIAELLASAATDRSELTEQIAGVYLFVLQHLTQSQLHHDVESLQEVISVLEVERETWRQVCEKTPGTPSIGTSATGTAQQIIVPTDVIRHGDSGGGSFSTYA